MRSSDYKSVLIRADAGPALGGGHVARCLALAHRLRQSDWRPTFAVRSETLELFPKLGETFPLIVLSDSDEVSELRSSFPRGFDLLVVDHYRRDATFESACRSWSREILVIDDLADRPHDADYLLDQTPGRQKSDYAGLVAPSCRLLLGADYALLRPEFARLRRASHYRESGIEAILVTFGASDPLDMISLTAEALISGRFTANIDVVVGNDYPHLARLQAIAASSPPFFTIHRATDRMANLMAKADLCIGAAGVTGLERCCLALPSLVIQTAENQTKVAAALKAAGAIIDLGSAAAQSRAHLLDHLRTALIDLFNARDRLASMSRAAAAVCDGRGTWRTLFELLPPRITSSGQAVTLRLASIADASLLLSWQAAPGMRRYFREPRIPKWREHLDWTTQCLADPDRLLLIALADGIPSAMIRLDEIAGPVEVSLLVAPEFQRRGIAKAALDLASELLPKLDFRASIHPDNLASQRLFLSSDYRQITSERYERAARVS